MSSAFPVVWVPEIVGYLMVALVFLALGETMLAGSHIKIDLFVGRLPRRPRDILELFTLTLSVGVAGFFTWHGVNTMLRSLEYGRRDAFGALNMPLYVPQAALPIGLSILTLVVALLVCRKLRAVLYGCRLGRHRTWTRRSRAAPIETPESMQQGRSTLPARTVI